VCTFDYYEHAGCDLQYSVFDTDSWKSPIRHKSAAGTDALSIGEDFRLTFTY